MKLRNKGTDAVSLYRPSGTDDSLTVDAGQEFELNAELVAEDAPEDAIVVRLSDGELRAFSTTRWELVDQPKAPAKSESVASPDVPADVSTAKAEG